MLDRKMMEAKEILSTYYDGDLKAETFIDENNNYGARFYRNLIWITDEVYKGHSEQYAEDAAENYVLGVKHLYIRS